MLTDLHHLKSFFLKTILILKVYFGGFLPLLGEDRAVDSIRIQGEIVGNDMRERGHRWDLNLGHAGKISFCIGSACPISFIIRKYALRTEVGLFFILEL